jgi:hypothetical protein
VISLNSIGYFGVDLKSFDVKYGAPISKSRSVNAPTIVLERGETARVKLQEMLTKVSALFFVFWEGWVER